MTGTMYINEIKKVGLTLPDLLVKQRDNVCGNIPERLKII
jgi:hypothetical protein